MFATRARDFDVPHLKRMFGCLAHQTFQDFEVIVVCDRIFTEWEYSEFYSSLNAALRSE